MTRPPLEPLKPCRVCGQAIPGEAQTCAQCKADQAPTSDQTDGLRSLGDGPAASAGAPPPRPNPPGAAATPSRAPGPRPEPPAARERPEPRYREGTFMAYVHGQWKEDPWFSVLLGLLVLSAIHALITTSWFALGVCVVVLWGLLTYNYWIYIICVALSLLTLVQSVLVMLAGYGSVITVAVEAAIVTILLRKYDQYM